MVSFPEIERPLANKADFHGLEGVVHLAAAGETPFLARQRPLFERFMADKAGGMAGRERIFAGVEAARVSVAGLLGVGASEIGFPQSAADAFNAVSRSVTGRGNVVMPQWEYPSAMYPWITGSDLDVRLVPGDGYRMDMQRFADAADADTRAIVVSVVSYFTGERVDLAACREIADRSGAMLLVDMSHAFGAAPFDARLVDFAIGCGYKWALGTHGAGIAFVNADRQPNWLPRETGWMSAAWVDATVRDATVVQHRDGRRFELGNPAALPVQILGAGVDYLAEVGVAAIERHVLGLTTRLRAGLVELGLDVLTPESEARRLGIVAFAIDNEADWRRHLEQRRILGWVGDERVRLSAHLYNDAADIDAAITAIDEIVRLR